MGITVVFWSMVKAGKGQVGTGVGDRMDIFDDEGGVSVVAVYLGSEEAGVMGGVDG